MKISFAILQFLAIVHCHPTTDIRIDPNLKTPGLYRDGVVYFRNKGTPENVQVHELYHSCQTSTDWKENEIEAKRIEKMYEQWRY